MGLQRIGMYHMGFFICLFFTVAGAVLAITLFFALGIREAWRMNTGRARRDSIRRMRQNAGTQRPVSGLPTELLDPSDKKIRGGM